MVHLANPHPRNFRPKIDSRPVVPRHVPADEECGGRKVPGVLYGTQRNRHHVKDLRRTDTQDSSEYKRIYRDKKSINARSKDNLVEAMTRLRLQAQLTYVRGTGDTRWNHNTEAAEKNAEAGYKPHPASLGLQCCFVPIGSKKRGHKKGRLLDFALRGKTAFIQQDDGTSVALPIELVWHTKRQFPQGSEYVHIRWRLKKIKTSC